MSRPLGADRKHAVVSGGSMAGLLASRVLSDHFERVTLIERDALPARAEQRRGVPQGRHTHGLLASGRNVLEKFFPGISEAQPACSSTEHPASACCSPGALGKPSAVARSAAESALFPGGKPQLTRNRRSARGRPDRHRRLRFLTRKKLSGSHAGGHPMPARARGFRAAHNSGSCRSARERLQHSV